MQVKSGDRVTIHGLAKRPELNGVSGILVGQGANGRVTVKLDSGEEVALKPANLGVQSGAPGGGPAGGAGAGAGPGPGGMPGGGGMPGFGGGMPGFGGGMPGFGGGMPDFGGMPGFGGAGGAGEAVEKLLASMGVRLPPGVTTNQAAMGAAVAVLFVAYLVLRVLPWLATGMALAVAVAGTKTAKGREMLELCTARASSAAGRPVPSAVVLFLLSLATAWMAKSCFGGGSVTVAAPATDAYGMALKEAYQQGYDDALAGLDPRPPKHIPSPDTGMGRESERGSSGFGMGSMLRYAMIAPYFYRMGQGPGGWSMQAALANLKANPGQAVMILMMLSGSGMFF